MSKRYAVHATTYNNYFLVTSYGLPVSEYFDTKERAQMLADKLNETDNWIDEQLKAIAQEAVYVNAKGQTVYA